jgi:hypothetical protein
MLDQTRLTESSEETVACGLVARNVLLDLSLDEPGQAAQRVSQAFDKWIRLRRFRTGLSR